MMRLIAWGLLSALLAGAAPVAAAAEHNGNAAAISDAAIATRAAQVETLRARLSLVSSPTASATLIDADDLLRQLRAAPAAKRAPIMSQLDAALARGDMEVDAAERAKQ